MTDLEKFKELFTSCGIPFRMEEGFGGVSATHLLLEVNSDDEHETNSEDNRGKITGYSGFFSWWNFDQNGKFLQVGISE